VYEFRLSDKDRERFGVDEWIGWDPWAISVGDLDELAERFSFDSDEWPEPLFGTLTIEQAGEPDAKPTPPRWQRRAAIWMALRQADLDVSWDDTAKLQHLKVLSRRAEEPGKDDPATGASTTPPSGTSSD
jgi:hypothetical protein